MPLSQRGLTIRQVAIAILIAEGLTNAEIAERLVISEGTVANHIANALKILGVRNRAQLAVWAVASGQYWPEWFGERPEGWAC